MKAIIAQEIDIDEQESSESEPEQNGFNDQNRFLQQFEGNQTPFKNKSAMNTVEKTTYAM